MKKVIVLFAAAAMFAFVGCNKEENTTYVVDQDGMVTLTMSGETWQSDKQTYLNQFNRVAFDLGDVALINGVEAAVYPCNATGGLTNPDDSPINRSFYGMMRVSLEALSGNDYVLYPAGLFTAGTAADMSDYTLTMPANADLMNVGADTYLAGYYWPMGTKLSGNNFMMKNAVALVNPSFVFGAPFINELATMTDSPIANEGVDVMTGYNFPQLYVKAITLTSTDQVLNGTAHIEYVDGNPILKMNGDGTNTLNINLPIFGVLVPVTDGTSETRLGDITIAPFAAGKHLQATVEFTLYFPETGHEYDFVYTGSSVELTETVNNNSILRSKRTYLSIDLYQAAAINKVTAL